MNINFPYVLLRGTVNESTPGNINGEDVERDFTLRVTGCHRSIEAVRRAKKPGRKVIGFGNFPNRNDYNQFAQELRKEFDLDVTGKAPEKKEPIQEKVKVAREKAGK